MGRANLHPGDHPPKYEADHMTRKVNGKVPSAAVHVGGRSPLEDADGAESVRADTARFAEQWGRQRTYWVLLLAMLVYGTTLNILGLNVRLLLSSFSVERASFAAHQGSASTLRSLCEFAVLPFLGMCSDVVGRKALMIFSFTGQTVAFTILLLGNDIQHYYMASVVGGCTAAAITTTTAIVADLYGGNRTAVTKRLGGIFVAFGTSAIIGSALAGYLGEHPAVRTGKMPALVAMAGAMFALLLVVVFLPGSALPQGKKSLDWRRANPLSPLLIYRHNSALCGIFALTFIQSLGAGSFGTIVIYVQQELGWTVREYGQLVALVGLVIVIWQAVGLGLLLKVFDEVQLVKVGLFAQVVKTVCYGLAREQWQWYAVVLGTSVWCVGPVCLKSLASQRVSREDQGSLQACISAYATVGQVLGPIAFGHLLTKSIQGPLPGLPYFVSAGIFLCALCFFTILSSRYSLLTQPAEVTLGGALIEDELLQKSGSEGGDSELELPQVQKNAMF